MQHYTLRIILLLFIFNSSACSPTTNDTNAIRLQSHADTSTIAVIMFDQIADWPFSKDYTPTNLTNNEVKTLDSVIRQYTKFYNDSLERNLGFSDKVDFQKFNYKRQYVPVINNKGEKEVWANFFCIEMKGGENKY